LEFFIGDATAGVFYGIIGIKMCGVASRTGEMPERLLAVCFLGWSVAYLLYLPVFALPNGLFPPIIGVCAWAADVIGNSALGGFILVVFRRQEVWARCLTVAAIACLVGGAVGRVPMGDADIVAVIRSPFYWMYQGGFTVLIFWLGAEAVATYIGATRRRRIGLCAAIICNRYLLVSIAATLWIIVELMEVSGTVIFALTGKWNPLTDRFLGVGEFASIITIWLAFIPPRFYQNWIESSEKQLEGVES
jgi:hypothetical protein